MKGVAGVTTIAVAVAAAIVALRRQIAIVTVVGESMQPTLADGDRVLMRRRTLSTLRPGHIVVIELPEEGAGWVTPPPRWPAQSRRLAIKRVAALPGDPWPARHMAMTALPPAISVRLAAGPVPAGTFAVLGDNPGGSYDSRVFGYCPADRLLGTVICRVRAASQS